ncbi:MAG: hypothetical protein NTW01_13330 [Gammaproteobacteria bacterium]|nr:hypothetical protein [Gammaproteobacteria bacterium]
MPPFPRAALALSALLLLPACNGHDDDTGPAPQRSAAVHFEHGDGAIGMDGDAVVIEAGGTPDRAVVGPDGRLTIGDTLIDTDSAGQAALKAYDAAAVAMKGHAIAIGRTGAAFGVDVLRDVVRGFFDAHRMEQVGKRARAGADGLRASLRDLCARMDTLRTAQQAAATAVPAFCPYAVLDAEQVRDCYEEIDEQANDAADDQADDDTDGPARDADPGADVRAAGAVLVAA